MIDQSIDSQLPDDIQASNFMIEANASMFKMLTSKIYSDIIAAPIREWGTNAIDACIEANKPIKWDVHVPSVGEPYFSVRDYATGLSEDQMNSLFLTFGASTKRNSNKFNGTYGIGRMSALAYTDNFNVISYYNGIQTNYLVSTKEGLPALVKLNSIVTNKPNGLQLSVSVKYNDIPKFREKIIAIYKYFNIKPNLSTPLNLNIDSILTAKDWYIEEYNKHPEISRSPRILMGNVIYALNGLYNDIDLPNNVIIEVPIGSISINPGRESLSYDEKTEKYLTDKLKKVQEEVQSTAYAALKKIDTLLNKIKFISKLKTYYNIRNIPIMNILTKTEIPIVNSLIVTDIKNGNYNYLQNRLKYKNITLYKINKNTTTAQKSGHSSSHFIIKDVNILYINDMVTRFSIILNDLATSSDIHYLQRHETNADLEQTVKDAIEFCEILGINYVLLSSLKDEYVTSKTSKSTKKLINSSQIQLKQIDTDTLTVRHYGIPDPNVTYFYVPLKGSTIDTSYPDITTDRVNAALHVQDILKKSFTIVGVQKKYLTKVQDLPNFIPLYKGIQDTINEEHTVLYYADNEKFQCYDNAVTKAILAADNLSTDFEIFKTELLKRYDMLRVYTPTLAEKISNVFNITTVKQAYTNTLLDLTIKYKVLNAIQFSWLNTIKEWLQLLYEKEKYETCCTK